MDLSNVIWKASNKYSIPADVMAAILMQESGYRLSAQNGDQDFGIAQINAKTIERYDFDQELLLEDLEYSVEAGARVLHWFHKRYAAIEDDWWVRFNVGTRSKMRYQKIWNNYKKLVERYM